MISIVFTWDCIYRAWSYGFYCFYLGLYLQSLELCFLLFLPGIVSTEPAVMFFIVFTWNCSYRAWSFGFYFITKKEIVYSIVHVRKHWIKITNFVLRNKHKQFRCKNQVVYYTCIFTSCMTNILVTINTTIGNKKGATFTEFDQVHPICIRTSSAFTVSIKWNIMMLEYLMGEHTFYNIIINNV